MSQQIENQTETHPKSTEAGSMIGDVLKHFRKSLGLTVPQVATIMEKTYNMKVAAKTIYGWESNQCYPPTPKMLALCEIYQINDIASQFPNSDKSEKLMITPCERVVIKHLRDRPELLIPIYRLLEITQEELDDAANSELAERRRLKDILAENE